MVKEDVVVVGERREARRALRAKVDAILDGVVGVRRSVDVYEDRCCGVVVKDFQSRVISTVPTQSHTIPALAMIDSTTVLARPTASFPLSSLAIPQLILHFAGFHS